jgi:hypothetical protein
MQTHDLSGAGGSDLTSPLLRLTLHDSPPAAAPAGDADSPGPPPAAATALEGLAPIFRKAGRNNISTWLKTKKRPCEVSFSLSRTFQWS